MTPFGLKVRELREARQITQKDMADRLGLSAAYLSALEHGHRGQPSRELVHDICAVFGLIWEEADDLQQLADLSHPRVVVDTAGLSPDATRMTNLLARRIKDLSAEDVRQILEVLDPDHDSDDLPDESSSGSLA